MTVDRRPLLAWQGVLVHRCDSWLAVGCLSVQELQQCWTLYFYIWVQAAAMMDFLERLELPLKVMEFHGTDDETQADSLQKLFGDAVNEPAQLESAMWDRYGESCCMGLRFKQRIYRY